MGTQSNTQWTNNISFGRHIAPTTKPKGRERRRLSIGEPHYHDEDDKLGFWRRTYESTGLAKLINSLRSIDGIDEIAAGLNQIDNIAGPSASAGLFILGFPFVAFGLLGMIGEQREAREDLEDLFGGESENDPEIGTKYAQHILAVAEKHNIIGPGAPIGSGKEIAKISVESLENYKKQLLTKIKDSDDEEKSKELKEIAAFLSSLIEDKKVYNAKWYDHYASRYLGVPAMALMAAGMVAGAAKSSLILDNVNKFGVSVAEASAMSNVATAGTVTTAIFAPANTLMAFYGAFRWYSGKQYEKQFNRNLDAVRDHLDSSVSEGAINYLEKIKKYDYKSRIVYGKYTAIGQSLIATGGWGSLGGVTLPVTLPITAIGIALAIYAVGVRTNADNMMEFYAGNDEEILEEDELDVDGIIGEANTKEKMIAAEKEFSKTIEESLEGSVGFKMLSLALNSATKGGTPDKMHKNFLTLCKYTEQGRFTNYSRDRANQANIFFKWHLFGMPLPGISIFSQLMYYGKRFLVKANELQYYWGKTRIGDLTHSLIKNIYIPGIGWLGIPGRIKLTSMDPEEIRMLSEKKYDVADNLFNSKDSIHIAILKQALKSKLHDDESPSNLMNTIKNLITNFDARNEEETGKNKHKQYNKFINKLSNKLVKHQNSGWVKENFFEYDENGKVVSFNFEEFHKAALKDPSLLEIFCEASALFVVKYQRNVEKVRRSSAADGLLKIAQIKQSLSEAGAELESKPLDEKDDKDKKENSTTRFNEPNSKKGDNIRIFYQQGHKGESDYKITYEKIGRTTKITYGEEVNCTIEAGDCIIYIKNGEFNPEKTMGTVPEDIDVQGHVRSQSMAV